MTKQTRAARTKALLRLVVPHRYRPLVRKWHNTLTWWAYVGTAVGCNCCGGRFRRFRNWRDDAGIVSPMCPRCGSLGRHRVNWLFLSGHPGLFNRPMDLLHIAPEPSLQGCLERVPNVSYLSADYDSALASERIDITSIGYPDERFDAVVCNHVLHYVDDDRRALLELRRILRPGGWALLQVPVNQSMAITLEDPTVTRPRDRKQVFGHPDHARIYGRDYPDRLQEAGFIVTVDSFVTRIPTARVSELGLDTGETIFFCRKPEG